MLQMDGLEGSINKFSTNAKIQRARAKTFISDLFYILCGHCEEKKLRNHRGVE